MLRTQWKIPGLSGIQEQSLTEINLAKHKVKLEVRNLLRIPVRRETFGG